jgi:hypothetical protein
MQDAEINPIGTRCTTGDKTRFIRRLWRHRHIPFRLRRHDNLTLPMACLMSPVLSNLAESVYKQFGISQLGSIQRFDTKKSAVTVSLGLNATSFFPAIAVEPEGIWRRQTRRYGPLP